MSPGQMWLDLLVRSVTDLINIFSNTYTFSLFQLEPKSHRSKQCWQYISYHIELFLFSVPPTKKSYPEFYLVVYHIGFLILSFKSFDISSPCNQNFLRRIKTMLQQIYDEKDVELLRIVQRKFLLEPSKEDQNYNLVNPDPKFDTSMGQAKAVRQILKDKVSTQ